MKDSKPLNSSVGRISLLHLAIIGLSLAMTISAWLYSKQQVDSRIENRFNAARDQTIGLIVDRMSRYEDALWSGVAAIRAQGGEISHQEWRSFASALKLEEKYPGVSGIGFIDYVERDRLAGSQAQRESVRRKFSIYPEHGRDVLLPIIFIEPEARNRPAVGLDMAHEENRRTGMLASRDTGTAQITGPIVLVQDSNHTPGFLFFTPLYQGGMPRTLAERRGRFLGAVYAPFVVKELVEGLLSKELRDLRFSIRDAGEVIYDEHSEEDALHDRKPMFAEEVTLDLYGRKWVVDIRTNLAFRAKNGFEQPTLILIGGLIIETLICALLLMMSRANSTARAYAHELTAELRAQSEKLAQANEEIEQFVYVTSHDLKTPVRGIGLLTDILEEDLEEHMGGTGAFDETRVHLNLIRERVQRMNALTQGIMEFSRIGKQEFDATETIRVEELIEACAADFKVGKSQIRLHSDVAAVSYDSHNFRRVMENLIGNAFKYHPSPDRAEVTVLLQETDGVLRVAVRDDGDGIRPEFQERIFEVFQTLQSADDKESTGIGLAIVKKSVQHHGYDIHVVSEPGHGAEFIFQWPLRPAAAKDDLGRAA